MLRFVIIAAALMIVSGETFAGHGGESSAPPPSRKGPATAPAQVANTERGPMWTDMKGMTLYYFDKDDSGNRSNCNDKCAERWIPLKAEAEAQATGDFTVIIRNDGSRMWAYRYRPLYTSQADKAPGDANGAAATTHWHIARPAY